MLYFLIFEYFILNILNEQLFHVSSKHHFYQRTITLIYIICLQFNMKIRIFLFHCFKLRMKNEKKIEEILKLIIIVFTF